MKKIAPSSHSPGTLAFFGNSYDLIVSFGNNDTLFPGVGRQAGKSRKISVDRSISSIKSDRG